MKFLILLPGVIHIYIFFLESFLWDKPRTMKSFGMKPSDMPATKTLAFNQGFYNLFLAIGVLAGFSLWQGIPAFDGSVAAGYGIMMFALGSIVAAGLVLIASAPVKWAGALLQIVPAVLGLGLALGKVA